MCGNMSSAVSFGLSGSESSSLDKINQTGLSPEEKQNSGNKDCEAKSMEVFQAVKSGSVNSVRSLVEKEGVSMLSARDEKGHTPAHWACLGGHAAILRYLIENHAPVNESSSDSLGAKPIHWAAVKGHIAAVAILTQAGVSIDTVDNKGFTPLIVACQYGQVTLAGYLMGKGARLQLTDNDGDTALHWAAFRGQSAVLPLLMYSGFNLRQKDSHGQTPLHLACINGNMSTVKLLCKQEGVELDPLDDYGHTPLMLAMGRKHKEVVSYLRKAAQVRTHFLPKINFWTVVFGPGNSKGPLLFFVVASFLWGYPMYIFKGLPDTYEDLRWLNVAFIVCNILMWVALYHANSVDPGYLPRNIPEYDQAIRQVAYVDEWKVGTSPISRLCHTCRTIKGPRAKHCRFCNRCVTMFDHHCPYIYNCVGYHNRVSFFIFSVLVSLAGYMAMYLSYYVLDKDGYPMRLDYLFGIGCYIFFQGIASFVVLSTAYHAITNITTNEGINWKRYSHLKDSEGRFHNPFNRGLVRNLLEFFLLIEPSTPEHLQNVSVGSSEMTSEKDS